MPNHVTNRVVVTGPDFWTMAFISAHVKKNNDGEDYFDFNTIIPKPDYLDDITAGTIGDYAAIIACRKLLDATRAEYATRFTDQEFWALMQSTHIVASHIKTYQEFLDKVKEYDTPSEHYPVPVSAMADSILKSVAETGCKDWYDWSIKYWGTKWGAYDFNPSPVEPGRFEFTFNTAWSPPIPIFDKLAERYPDLTIDVNSFDEGWNFAWQARYINGVCSVKQTIDPTDELYELVYGYPPERDEDESED